MERAVLWAAFAVGLMGWLVAGAAGGMGGARESGSARDHEGRGMLPFVGAALTLTVLIFALTLPERGAWGQGRGFGYGWLAGGLAALGGAWACGAFAGAAARSDPLGRGLRVAAPLWPVLAAGAAISLWGRAFLLDALGGMASGHLAVALVLAIGAQRVRRGSVAPLILAGAAFAVVIGGTILLGTFRDFRSVDLARGTWAAVALGLGVTVAFIPLVGAAGAALIPRGQFAGIARWGLGALLLLGVGRALSLKLVDESGLTFAVAIGIAVAVVAWWGARDESPRAGLAAPMAALAMLAGLMASFVVLQGVGMGLMLLGFWPAVLFALDDALSGTGEVEARPAPATERSGAPAAGLLQVAAFGAVVVLYRGVQTRFHTELRGVAITDQYALWGFLAGAVVPTLLAGAVMRGRSRGVAWRVLARVLLAGVVMVALPAVLMLFFGPKCALALVMGLAVGCLLRPAGEEVAPENLRLEGMGGGGLVTGWALFGAMMVAQWTHRLLPLAEWTRPEKMRGLAVLLVVAAVLGGVELAARLWEGRGAELKHG